MKPAEIRIVVKSNDAATMIDLEKELEALRGHEPEGTQLIDNPDAGARALEPLLSTVAIALIAGMGGALGRELGLSLISWFVERMRAVAARRKSNLILSVGKISLQVDEHTIPAQAAAKLAAGLSS
jgi:hypothetical protein